MSADLDAAVEAARAKWPKLKVNPADFRAWLAVNGARALPNAADLYLAFACRTRDAEASRQLVQLVERQVEHAVRRLKQGPAFAQDVSQQLLAKLLVADEGARPKIETYSGRGTLDAWLRAAAVRTALNMLEQMKSQSSLDANLAVASRGGSDPELAHVRRRYGKAMKGAVESALKDLEPDDRNVLRFYFVEGLTVDQIARMRSVHKSTVSRLIGRVRTKLLEQVKDEVAEAANARREELSSVLRAIVSQLDVSLERALR